MNVYITRYEYGEKNNSNIIIIYNVRSIVATSLYDKLQLLRLTTTIIPFSQFRT